MQLHDTLRRATKIQSFLLAAACAFAPALASAEDTAPEEPGNHCDHPHKPPQAAYDACVNQAADDACEVKFHEHAIEGVCTGDPEGALFCRPNHMPPHRPDAPPMKS